MDNFF